METILDLVAKVQKNPNYSGDILHLCELKLKCGFADDVVGSYLCKALLSHLRIRTDENGVLLEKP